MGWFDALRGIAEVVGAGDEIKRAFERPARSESAKREGPERYVYERVLTRPRDPSVNDR
jgi:hypothetical protein